MGFSIASIADGDGWKIFDETTGESLIYPRNLNHWHMGPWSIVHIQNVDNELTFSLVYKVIFHPTENEELFVAEYLIVDWKLGKSPVDSADGYLERAGEWLCLSSQGKTNVARSMWKKAPDLKSEYLNHVPG